MSAAGLIFAPLSPVLAAPVANGELEEGFPSAVGLGVPFGENPFHVCTGTLITPRIVLSAGHCSADYDIETVAQFGKAFIGPDESDPEAILAFEDGGVHPEYLLEYGPSGVEIEFDYAVLVLEEEAPVRPSFLHLEPITEEDVVDVDFKVVGYGITNATTSQGSGVKRSGWMVGTDLLDHAIELEPGTEGTNICSGDSGGPTFREAEDGTWVQWGINSWGDTNCRSVAGVQRIDLGAEWILDWVEEVHGTRDLCEAGGWHEDGVCDEAFCPDDPDCLVAEDTGGAGGGGDDGGCKGCAAAGAPVGWIWALLPLGLAWRRRA